VCERWASAQALREKRGEDGAVRSAAHARIDSLLLRGSVESAVGGTPRRAVRFAQRAKTRFAMARATSCGRRKPSAPGSSPWGRGSRSRGEPRP
jgi:hypothetical protein